MLTEASAFIILIVKVAAFITPFFGIVQFNTKVLQQNYITKLTTDKRKHEYGQVWLNAHQFALLWLSLHNPFACCCKKHKVDRRTSRSSHEFTYEEIAINHEGGFAE